MMPQYDFSIIMSNENYKKTSKINEIDNAIAESEAEYQAKGILYDAMDTLARLRRKLQGNL